VWTHHKWNYNVKFSDVPIFDGVVVITSLYLVAGLNDVCCSVYWCLKMNARLYLIFLVFLLPQHSLVFSHLKKMQYIMLIYWYSLITNQEGSNRLHAWERMEYMYIVFVDISVEYIYLACSLYDVGLLWAWWMCLWVHIFIENLEYRCFFMWHMVW
jgi:hypothetical protein